jgi:hypothetical protein
MTGAGIPISDGERFVALLDEVVAKAKLPEPPLDEIVATLTFLRDNLAPRVPEIAEWGK